jgi:hypothetical protein
MARPWLAASTTRPSFYNNQGQFGVEPGGFGVYVGDSSVGGLHGQFNVS